MRKLSLFILTFLCSAAVFSQQLSMGKWDTFLSYYQTNSIAFEGDIVYCGTYSGMFTYNKATGEFQKFDKTDGFNGAGIQTLAYSESADALMIVYDNANIDLLKGNRIINMPQLYNYPIAIQKSVNDIYIQGDSAVLSCDFGIMIFDLKKEIVLIDVQFNTHPDFDTLKCQSAAILNGRYYFATNNGLYSVSTSLNIKNLNNWNKETGFPDGFYKRVLAKNNRMYTLFSKQKTTGEINQDTLFVFDGISKQNFPNGFNKTLIDFDIQQNRLALLYAKSIEVFDVSTHQSIYQLNTCIDEPNKLRINGNQYYVSDVWSGLKLIPHGALNCSWVTISGPPTSKVFDLEFNKGVLWAVAGGTTTTFSNIWEMGRVFYLKDNEWKEVPLPSEIRDVFKIYSDPLDPSHVFASSWAHGLIEIKNFNQVTIYNKNTLLEYVVGQDTIYRAGGVIYDKDRNLWVPNSNTDILIKKLLPNGTWMNYPFSTVVPNKSMVSMIEIDDYGNLWIASPNRGIIHFNPTTNQRRLLNTSLNNGSLPDLVIRSIRKDKNGQIWVGTRDGFRYFSSSQANNGGAVNGQSIVIKAADGNNELLLNQTIINEIEVDDANRKWFATEGSGILVIDENGEIERTYTAANSALLDDNVRALEFDRQNGYLYIATGKGLMVLRQEATEADELAFADQIYAYPNPVKPSWDGPITVKGLAENARVKFTDVNGNIVYETRALGGQAVWNGKLYSGQRAKSGVYLVFAMNSDGSSTMVTKILFIN